MVIAHCANVVEGLDIVISHGANVVEDSGIVMSYGQTLWDAHPL